MVETIYTVPPETRAFLATGVERAIEWIINWQRSYPGARFLAEYHSALAWVPVEIRQAVLRTHSRLSPINQSVATQTDVEIEILLDDDYLRSSDFSEPTPNIPEDVDVSSMAIGTARTVALYYNYTWEDIREADMSLLL